MFDLHERLRYLARSLEGVCWVQEGSTERFYHGSPALPKSLFLEVIESGGVVYGFAPHPACHFHTSALLPHPHHPGWIRLADPSEEDEEALWQSIRFAHARAAQALPLAQTISARPALLRSA
ncbi:MAG: hypothetical protein NZN28_11765 [Meiothermus sp.]|uniref:hypothetical protein n=1 Tax=Meiothermus sp. TaxID=1955249 RepID=UPI0025FF4232|nr:hypothetical protein [Meiothermus sp.]MCS7069288.1 hypothetical protein [Meiothermus sp.]